MMEQLCIELLKIEASYLDKVTLDINHLSVHQFDEPEDRMFVERVADVVYGIEEQQLKIEGRGVHNE
ncbi:hypothetical protein [Bacillus sp. FJAT-44742]|uniref:hypothetical protein n=1 Tax=Bacillus sp. FJAT-44742 TaxID=2014005 RepID=UPI000C2394D5|nr:hypothetical protein [Bacillus sp. FJAT-44742]